MALPRILCIKCLRSCGMRTTFFNELLSRHVLQTKERYKQSLGSTSCHWNVAPQRRCVASFPQKLLKPEISPVLSNVQNYSSSSLYINRSEDDRTPVVNVDLNLLERLNDVTELQQNMSTRKMEMNVLQLAEDFKHLMKLELEKNQLEEKRKNISDMMAALSKAKADDSVKRSREILKPQGKALKQKLKSLNKDLYELENSVMLQSLQLPNVLHEETPLEEAVIIQEPISTNDLKAVDENQNHINMGQKLNWLKTSDVGSGAYYLMGKLAMLEQDLIYQFSQNMAEIGFFQLNCPEIFRTLVVEGCGVDFKSPDKKIYTLQNDEFETSSKVEHLSHFVGVSSMSFAAYLTKMELKTENLPLRYFTIGKSYRPPSPSFADSGLYEAAQTTKCEACSVCSDQTQADLEFHELVNIVSDWYSALELSLRLVLLPAADLQPSEMKKMVIEAWAPSLQRYIQVGSVSSSGVYISQRLMITHSGESLDPESVHLVHAELLDVSKLLAFLMEYGKISEDQLPIIPRGGAE